MFMKNILILSCGTRNKVVQAFKNDWNGRVVATDCSPLASALYEADEYYIVPKINEKNYLSVILEICEKEQINAVFSLIDPELNLLADNKNLFEERDIIIIGSKKKQCDMSLDKWAMYEWLMENGYKCAKSYRELDKFILDYENRVIDFPVVIKPICGSASLQIVIANSLETVKNVMDNYDNMMIQEFLNGQEIGVDCYIDLLSEKLVEAFSKKKIKMRAGETDKSVSFKDDKLFGFVQKFLQEVGYLGVVDVDIFDVEGEYYISEVNPRFGGGYPHAYACGVDFTKLIYNNLNGVENVCNIGNYKENIYMIKYNEICIKSEEGIYNGKNKKN